MVVEGKPDPYIEDCLVPQNVEHLFVKCLSMGDYCACFFNTVLVQGWLAPTQTAVEFEFAPHKQTVEL